MDMTRFHKFTIGAAWKSDFGDPGLCFYLFISNALRQSKRSKTKQPTEVEKDYDYILTYSPLHNIDPSKQYPIIMCKTADHDDRVVPLHTYKFVATAQHLLKDQPNQVFASVDTDVGHDYRPTEKVLSDLADTYAFMAVATGTKWTP